MVLKRYVKNAVIGLIKNKARRIRRRNNKRWLRNIFALESLNQVYSTPIMYKKEDLAEINIFPQSVIRPPVIRHFADIREVYKKEFRFRMTRRLSRTKQRQLFEKIGFEVKTIKFQRKGEVSTWRLPIIKRQNFMAIVSESLGRTVTG